MKKPTNEPVLEYKKGSTERKDLEKALQKYASMVVDVPICIGKERITRNLEQKQVMVIFVVSAFLYPVSAFGTRTCSGEIYLCNS